MTEMLKMALNIYVYLKFLKLNNKINVNTNTLMTNVDIGLAPKFYCHIIYMNLSRPGY